MSANSNMFDILQPIASHTLPRPVRQYCMSNNTRTSSHTSSSTLKSDFGGAQKPKIDPWNVEASMEYMDVTHSAHFREWVRSEENLHLTAHHLRRVLTESTVDTEVRKVANGLRWIMSDWSTKSVSELMKLLGKGRSITWTATVTNLISAEFPLFPDTAEVVMAMIDKNSPEQASAFVKVISADWDLEAVTELVFHVGREFEWDVDRYLEFITSYAFNDSGKERNGEERERCMKFLFSARSIICEITKKNMVAAQPINPNKEPIGFKPEQLEESEASTIAS
ncbi:hypothetical protein SARC_11115 [Sphaeroforma arctica JP610]|uniref:Uncharacterized protein n=1 Tax=Sphaeroforma arctica JP610 TaxID=667725 RepID=A0A0L0FK07_9EUKA|nr:hypothetical protein SARC_11115 [Sphaeroforma arctica JP610]KNC76383.1 hypothetical protein SARC_11115 [Sphaeroforma arctica JP610]|eukprot:XP_014150285.1 hypothetical protein SARC_11115 [Sphaeroforma arctica JP610]